MPRWGLTKKLRDLQPWGSGTADAVQGHDGPVHVDIYTTVLEQALIDTPRSSGCGAFVS